MGSSANQAQAAARPCSAFATRRTALMHAGIPDDEIQQFIRKVTAGDYNLLMITRMEWANVE